MDIINGISIIGRNGTKVVPDSFNANADFVNTWLFMGSPLPVTIILGSYLLFVLKIGPAYMKKREPYKLQNIMPLYNAAQVLISCFLLYVCVSRLARNGLTPKTCITETEYGRRSVTTAMYYYLLAKLSELLDTIFFVLRKKDNQVTFLHVYHHTCMVVVTWTAIKYEPTYALTFLGMMNSFVHVIMYTYYGLSSYPNLAKYLWWKKYITSLQLVQFVLVLTHFAVASMKSECTPSVIMSVAMMINVFLFIYLFGSFYVRTYNKKNSIKITNDKESKLKNDLCENDKKMYENEKQISNGYEKAANDFTSASITVNDTYRIRFNLKSTKLT